MLNLFDNVDEVRALWIPLTHCWTSVVKCAILDIAMSDITHNLDMWANNWEAISKHTNSVVKQIRWMIDDQISEKLTV